MRIYYPLCDVSRVHSFYFPCKSELRLHFFYHRSPGFVSAVPWTGGYICSIMCKPEALILSRSAKPSTNSIHDLYQVFGICVFERCFIERKWILEKHINVMRLLIHLIRINARSQNKRRIHLPAAPVGKI